MIVRHANKQDIDQILKIYTYAREFMHSHGNLTQWTNGYPGLQEIEKDMHHQCLYVCEDNHEVVGVLYYNYGKDVEKSYLSIDGAWIKENTYGVVHRIASMKKGVGSFLLDWAYHQHNHVRIDTHEDNVPMQQLLLKLGYTKCGIVFLPEIQETRIAFEK